MQTVRFVIVAVISAVCSIASWAQLTEAEKSAVLIQRNYEGQRQPHLQSGQLL